MQIIGFYHETGPHGCFSNWYPIYFVVDGVTYCSSEQYMMHQKALLFHDEKTAEKILKETDQSTIKHLGRLVSPFDRDTWERNNMPLMKKGLTAKFSQNKDILKELLDTGDAILAECAPGDRIWGIGLSLNDPAIHDFTKWRGENRLGRVLMQVREELKICSRIKTKTITAEEKKRIHDFAVKYHSLYLDSKTTEEDVEEGFAEECFALGFEMDSGARFEKFISDKSINTNEELNNVLNEIDDIELLTSTIFSRWRNVTHWDDFSSLLDDGNRSWFVTAFARLAYITRNCDD